MSAPEPAGGFAGAIFDVDGVIVDSPHQRAWREALRELMEGEWRDLRARSTWTPEGFTPQVYERLVSGKPRMAGALAALEYFHVPDPEQHVGAYADHKQAMVIRLIQAGEFVAYPDALRFLLAVRASGVRVAAASSSKNAGLLLSLIRPEPAEGRSAHAGAPGPSLAELLDADVSGRDFAHGKPDPEIFLTAAAELGTPPARSFVVEDAASGVQAAKAGDMMALAIARAGDADLLAGAGADLVVTSLDHVDLDALGRGRLARTGG